MIRTVVVLGIVTVTLYTAHARDSSLQDSKSNHALRIARFDLDVTPSLGTWMAYQPVRRLDEMTLRCRGIVLLGAGKPIVLCAMDWIGIANEAHDAFRDSLAKAAGTTRERVAVHAVHQHDAPACDFTAERMIRNLGLPGYQMIDSKFTRQIIKRTAEAVQAALPAAEVVTHYGWGVADVKQVASNRRILGPDGKVRAVRYTMTLDPALRAEPEGVIDPQVSLLSFWNETQPVAVLSYYACHPQSYYLTGIPSPDFPGIARFIRGQAVPEALHVHFNGAGGNIGAGKYNDGAEKNRMTLALRLAEGMRKAFDDTQKYPLDVSEVDWKVAYVKLPVAPHLAMSDLVETAKTAQPRRQLAVAVQMAWLERCEAGHAIDISCLYLGDGRVIHMPGELFVEYQLAAKSTYPDLHVAMAAYGDYGPGYIGTRVAYFEGGYETGPRETGVAPEVEKVLMSAIQELLKSDALEPRPVAR